jgi:hypothetical protein
VPGTVKLLMTCKESGSLPHLSEQLGQFVRTNCSAERQSATTPRAASSTAKTGSTATGT